MAKLETQDIGDPAANHDEVHRAGECPVCGINLANHPRCDACGTLCGHGHMYNNPSPYLGHKLCDYCRQAWQRLSRLFGREATWAEFLLPQPKMFDENDK